MNPDWQKFLTAQGARIENGQVHAFESAASLEGAATLTDLSHKGIIAVHGADARSFLQGQLSTDLEALSPNSSQLSSWSSAKGRVITVLRIVPQGERILLLLPRSLLASVLKRLSMYVLRAQVKLDDVSDTLIHIGLAGDGAVRLLQAAKLDAPTKVNAVSGNNETQVVRLHGTLPRFLIIGGFQPLSLLWKILAGSGAAPVTENEWALQKIRAGEPTIYPETSERFVAQMLGLEELDAVNFKKGCYIGQEIIARAHFRGTVKRHMLQARCDAIVKIAPGTTIENSDTGQPVGDVLDARLNRHGIQEMLVVLQDDHRNDSLRIADDGPPLAVDQTR